MHRHTIARLWLLLSILFCAGTTAASAPAACTGGYCTYLPLVSTPELIAITNVDLHGTHYGGGTNISGEVIATTSTPVYSVTLEVRSYDEQGNVIATSIGRPLLTATLPGQPNPFFFDSGFAPYEYPASYDIQVSSLSRTYPQTILPVTVNVTSARCVGSKFEVEGTMSNQNAETLEDVRGVLWIRGNPYRRWTQQFAERLEPLETVPFLTSLIEEYCGVFGPVPYQIVAQGVVP